MIHTVSLLIFATLFGSSLGQLCREDYKPCDCLSRGQGLEIYCGGVEMSQVQVVFNRTSTLSYWYLYLNPTGNDDVIPADVLMNKRFTYINIECSTSGGKLAVDAEAFRTTSSYTQQFRLDSCNMQDFSFLEKFVQLFHVYNTYSSNLHLSLPTLPYLPKFDYFTNNFNILPVITEDTLPSFTIPVRKADLSSNQVAFIAPGAFKGDFSEAFVSLGRNNLTRFESSVFQGMLQQMEASPDQNGFISISGNPIDCTDDPCHLAWLIRDNQNLLQYIYDGKCSNGTSFSYLNPEEFGDCQ